MRDLVSNKRVAIIGGGPGGLMLARLLQQADVDVTVYERDVHPHVRQQGSTLDMHHDTGLKAIITAGLLDEFKKRYRPGADRSALVDSQMNLLFADQVSADEGFGHAEFRPEIDRGPLRDMLMASLKKDTIVWDAKFRALQPQKEGWMIQFANGTSAYADLVIGADGANSKLRPYITPIKPVYSGATAIEGNLVNAPVNAPHLWKLANGGSLHALENGRTIFFITKGDGTLTFLIGVKKPENWLADSGIDLTNKDAVAAWFQEEFADWSPKWAELFATNKVSFTPRVWYHFPPDQHWPAQPNLTLLGDAAHRVPPYAGEGANQALADALDLYEALCLGQFTTLQQAIAAYERNMFQRSARITQESVRNTEGFHSTNNIQFLMSLYSTGAATNAVEIPGQIVETVKRS
ncbi:FAD-dependent oxidoreductase [Spirosoma litoris]